MDDQFGGRTDDDLFFDDFEPVSEPRAVETVETVAAPPPPPPAVATPPVEPPPVEPPKPEPVAPKPVERPPPQKPAAKRPPTAPRGGLANSRFADKPAAAPRPPRQTAPASTPPAKTTTPTPQPPAGPAASQTVTAPVASPAPPAAASSSPATTKSSSPASHQPREKPQPPPTAPTGPAAGTTTPTTTASGATPGANTALNAAARLGSGANPRTKLTETELAVKMEQMRILNAEKTRKFEQAEQDERSHAEAYARGMEEARQRRKLDEERRRRGEEERKRMDDERARNRERKLKAMSMKEGGWDEGKDALAQEEEKRAFRGANGGVRGTKSGAGLAGSRFARDDEAGDRHAAAGEERRGGRGRGRGRGQGRGGRGGRGGGFGSEHERDPVASNGGAQEAKPAAAKTPAPAPVISTDEFPALPGKSATGDVSLPMLSPLGRWDDEMEAFDAKLKSATDAAE